ncbi:MAG TPA: M28 family peptidase [Solirubrobacteraceae bacterium]|nr:M28 family peptidase [Solirubrobacteraceae bacterium]
MNRIHLLVAAVVAACIATAAAPAHAVEVVPDINALQYEPIGHFKPGDPLPPANGFNTGDTAEFFQQEYADGIFNPSGNFNAYDTNVFEVLAMPFRGAGDEFADDPLGNGTDGGDPDHGQCSGDPRNERPMGGSNGYPAVAGECFNHQLEYIEYYERTMMSILGKFGAYTKRYEFFNPSDPGANQFQAPFGGFGLEPGNTLGGRAINPAVIVPGTGESDETIVIGAHFDKTNDGPAAAWDSQEGHAQMIRVAKLMADYWDAKDARPTATVKFIPWDGEESGTLGSEHYTQNIIPPGDEENKVRGYWNTDPCAGGYPAFRFGNRANRTQLGIQLANPFRNDDPLNTVAGVVLVIPENLPEKYHARINDFNAKAPAIVEEVFDHLDDNLAGQPPDAPEIFISTAEGTATKPSDIGTGPTASVTVGQARPFLFSSDWRNFEDRGIPFFNPGPEITGPSSFGDPGNPDALVILHSPNDNLSMLNRYAGTPSNQDGDSVAEGWVKGMEMCAHLLAWGMLQPHQGGASLEEVGKVSAYYEALPNEAGVNEFVHFDGSGSHIQTADGTTTEGLQYEWDFGDGTTGTGRNAYHRYGAVGTYQTKLTVTNTGNGQTASMELPVVVQAVPAVPLPFPSLEAPRTDEDGTFDLTYSLNNIPSNLVGWQILESTDYHRLFNDDMEGPVDAKWTASEPTHADIEPWQESDSSTRKFRGNAMSSGAQSYWTGVPPEQFKAAGIVQQGESILTLKEPIQVPPESGSALTYNSLFLNESDDKGLVQVAKVREGELSWETIDTMGGGGAAEPPENICNPSDPGNALNAGLRPRYADLSNYPGERLYVRFVYQTGPTNPAASQPCGWYIDDVEIGAGVFRPADRSNQIAPVGQKFEGTYTVRDRQKGLYAYRVAGLYPPDGEYEGPASAIRVVDVTQGANPPGRENRPDENGQNPRPPSPPAGVCPYAPRFKSASVRRSRRGLRFLFETFATEPTTVEVFQTSRGRRVMRGRRVARFTGRLGSFRWSGRSRRRITSGTYFVRFTTGDGPTQDVRRVTLLRSKGRFRKVRSHHRRRPCEVLRTFKLSSPAFGGRNRRRLGIAYRLLVPARVTITVRRGKKLVRRFRAGTRSPARTHRHTLPPRGLRRGVYRVTAAVTAGGRTTRHTLVSRKV